MRIYIKNLLLIIFLYSLIKFEVSAHVSKKTARKKSLAALMFLKNKTGYNVTENKRGCRWLKSLKHQYKLCMTKKGLSQVLKDTRNLSLTSCSRHFKYEQWPCLLKNKFFKKVYRETAFLFSLSTSAFMYETAKSCAAGNLANCACGTFTKSKRPSEWKWGGCSDNTKAARLLTNKLFQLKKKDGDAMRTIQKYNSEVGINMVLKHEEKICSCHGMSGSCAFRICLKRVHHFDRIMEDLKREYHQAVQIQSGNDVTQYNQATNKDKLIFFEDAVNFCPDTHGRFCESSNNCATLCCGRGAMPKVETFRNRCNCDWWKNNTFNVSCQECEMNQTVYVCN